MDEPHEAYTAHERALAQQMYEDDQRARLDRHPELGQHLGTKAWDTVPHTTRYGFGQKDWLLRARAQIRSG